jgi:hypothetical protein
MRLDKADVIGESFPKTDAGSFSNINLGAHVPDMSSEVEFFDILYLGIFAILSPAFDGRLYGDQPPPPTLLSEIAHAVDHFNAILLRFKWRFVILLRGLPVDVSYVADRLLAEFAAAAMVFAYSVGEGDGGIGEDVLEITPVEFAAKIDGILRNACPKAYSYYSRCFLGGHSHFIWTGPEPQILPRTDELETILSLSTKGEMLDYPAEPIYHVVLEDSPPPSPAAVLGKRPVPEDLEGGAAAKKLKATS